MTVLLITGAPKKGHLGDNCALEPSRVEPRPKYPIALIKQACPDKADHHDLFGSPFKLPKSACAAPLTLSRLSGQSCDGSRGTKGNGITGWPLKGGMHAVDDL